ncbi:DJ-1/PfpI family protein [Clostridium sp. ATCC 25772]|uniref:DJ-1/PfpI family protein n=1 Tax=Clostridium sp. ATCC 25772 TaxID=1676991 RepID=UPI0007826200|nr:DJ-1/PfpI family protein [Clostridium sp. ATCC 25772]
MKKVAVLIYDEFCNFEISVALEMLAMVEKPFVIVSKTLNPIRSEEGIKVIADKTIDEVDLEEFDALLLPGAMDIREVIEDNCIIEFIKSFSEKDKIIGAISIAPILLLKAGVLKNKRFMAGVNQEDLLQEGFSKRDLEMMIGWNDNLNEPIEEGYIQDNNIITSVSYNFIKWAMAFGRAIGINVYPKSFGIEK